MDAALDREGAVTTRYGVVVVRDPACWSVAGTGGASDAPPERLVVHQAS